VQSYLRKERLDAADLCEFNIGCCATVREVGEADLEKKENLMRYNISVISSEMKYYVRVTYGLVCFNGSIR
jgi:hypothetical protein